VAVREILLGVRPQAFLLLGLTVFLFYCEGEADCTSEMAAGQFNIFGAIEEFVAMDSHGVSRVTRAHESD